jgi:hypothetical protein
VALLYLHLVEATGTTRGSEVIRAHGTELRDPVVAQPVREEF